MRISRRRLLQTLGAACLSPPSRVPRASPSLEAAPDPNLSLSGVPADRWAKEPGVRIGPGGPYARRLVAHPSNSLRLRDGTLRLYFYGADADHGYLLSATSTDWGLTWRADPGYRLRSQPREKWVSDPFVLPLRTGGYRLYYKAYRPGWRGCLFSAYSRDGLEWEREGIRLMPGPPGAPDSARTCFPWLAPGAEPAFRLYYGGSADPEPFGLFRILSATSRDGITWRRDDGVRIDRGMAGAPDRGGALMPAVYRLGDGRVRMYYVGGNGEVGWRAILSAVSRDGLKWRREPGVRLAPGPEGTPDAAGLVKPSVLGLPDGRFRMFYVGMDGASARILSATAERGDGVT